MREVKHQLGKVNAFNFSFRFVLSFIPLVGCSFAHLFLHPSHEINDEQLAIIVKNGVQFKSCSCLVYNSNMIPICEEKLNAIKKENETK